jgi:hypothetical protein
MSDKYDGYTTRDLIDHHNAVASDVDGARPLTKWKGSKEDLIARIEELERTRDGSPSEEDLLDHGELAEEDREVHSSDVKAGAIFITEPSDEEPLPDHGDWAESAGGNSDGGTETHEMVGEDVTAEPWNEMDQPSENDVAVGEGNSGQPSGDGGESGNPDAGPDSAGFPFHKEILDTVSLLRETTDPKRMTVQHYSLNLLAVVLDVKADKDGETVSWGASYEEVIAAVKLLVPTCKTTVQSQRWYHSKVRRGNEGEPWDQYEVPDRRYASERPEKGGREKLVRCPDCARLHSEKPAS